MQKLPAQPVIDPENRGVPQARSYSERTWLERLEVAFFYAASVFWAYILINTFFYSIDSLLIDMISSKYDWIVRYKFVIFIVIVFIITLPL